MTNHDKTVIHFIGESEVMVVGGPGEIAERLSPMHAGPGGMVELKELSGASVFVRPDTVTYLTSALSARATSA